MRKALLRRQFSVGFLVATCLCTSVAVHAEDGSPSPAKPQIPTTSPPKAQVGNASWYGHKFHRKRTASGALFDVEALTAAHRNLPLNSWAKVTALATGKSVVVQINDRGPHIRSRLIDVSHAAAEQLGILARGVARVSVEPCASVKSCIEPDDEGDSTVAQAGGEPSNPNPIPEQ